MENNLENAEAFMRKTNRSFECKTNAQMMVAYASEVREIKLPSEDDLKKERLADMEGSFSKDYIDGIVSGFCWTIEKIKNLNGIK